MTWPVGCALWLSIMASATGGSGTCFAQTYLQGPPGEPLSPSSQNWENSLQNWKNNPITGKTARPTSRIRRKIGATARKTGKNSAQNYNNKNGIYDRNGNRIGYAVPRADGSGMNFFDNSGRRIGYQNDNNR